MPPYKRPQTRQPQQARRIRADHTLASVCLGGWIGSAPGTLLQVGASMPLSIVSGVTQEDTEQGRGAVFGSYAGTARIDLPSADKFRFIGAEGSIVAGVRLGALSTGNYAHVWSVRDSSFNLAGLILGLDGASFSGGRVAVNISGAGDLLGSSGSAKQNAFAVYGAEWGNGRALYVNGVLEASDAATNKVGANSITPCIGNRSTGGRALSQGPATFIFWFTERIGADWHQSLALDPWQMLEPDLFPMGADSVATVPTLSSLTATDITATTARLGLTLTF